MVMSLKYGLGLMSWTKPKIDELDLRGRWVVITNEFEPKIDELDLMG